MNEQKMRSQFEADMWRDALEEGAEPNLTRGPNGDYVQPWISGAWHGYQAAIDATQRDAMAVAEAVRDAMVEQCNILPAVSAMTANQSYAIAHRMKRIDLAAIVEAVRPGKRGQEEPAADWWDYLIEDISAIECRYHGDPSYDHDAYWMRERVIKMLEQRRGEAPQPASAQQQGEPVAWLKTSGSLKSLGFDSAPVIRLGADSEVKADSARPLIFADTAPPAPACSVPDGYAMVPVEPTPEMLSAAEHIDWGDADVRGSCHNMWNAMLAATPKGGNA